MVDEYDLTVLQGESFDLTLLFKDSTGAVQDLTGYNARMQARVKITDAEFVFEWSTAGGELVVDGPAGTVTFAVDDTPINALSTDNKQHSWPYDLFLIQPNGEPVKVLMGHVLLIPRVTRYDN